MKTTNLHDGVLGEANDNDCPLQLLEGWVYFYASLEAVRQRHHLAVHMNLSLRPLHNNLYIELENISIHTDES